MIKKITHYAQFQIARMAWPARHFWRWGMFVGNRPLGHCVVCAEFENRPAGTGVPGEIELSISEAEAYSIWKLAYSTIRADLHVMEVQMPIDITDLSDDDREKLEDGTWHITPTSIRVEGYLRDEDDPNRNELWQVCSNDIDLDRLFDHFGLPSFSNDRSSTIRH